MHAYLAVDVVSAAHIQRFHQLTHCRYFSQKNCGIPHANVKIYAVSGVVRLTTMSVAAERLLLRARK